VLECEIFAHLMIKENKEFLLIKDKAKQKLFRHKGFLMIIFHFHSQQQKTLLKIEQFIFIFSSKN
jgi:hypothetical protein